MNYQTLENAECLRSRYIMSLADELRTIDPQKIKEAKEIKMQEQKKKSEQKNWNCGKNCLLMH